MNRTEDQNAMKDGSTAGHHLKAGKSSISLTSSRIRSRSSLSKFYCNFCLKEFANASKRFEKMHVKQCNKDIKDKVMRKGLLIPRRICHIIHNLRSNLY